MPIDRTQYNLLVDDDGTNTKGSPWNKAAINNVLLNPIDLAIQTAAVNVPFNAADFFGLSAGLVWTVGSAAVIHNRYLISGKMMYWEFYMSWFSGGNVISGTPGPAIGMRIPGGKTGAPNQYMPVAYSPGIAGVSILAGLVASCSGNTTLGMSRASGNITTTDVPGFISTFWFEIL